MAAASQATREACAKVTDPYAFRNPRAVHRAATATVLVLKLRTTDMVRRRRRVGSRPASGHCLHMSTRTRAVPAPARCLVGARCLPHCMPELTRTRAGCAFPVQSSLFAAALCRGGAVFNRGQRGLYGGKKRISGNNVSFSEIRYERQAASAASATVVCLYCVVCTRPVATAPGCTSGLSGAIGLANAVSVTLNESLTACDGVLRITSQPKLGVPSVC
jgi:hypothetical protein